MVISFRLISRTRVPSFILAPSAYPFIPVCNRGNFLKLKRWSVRTCDPRLVGFDMSRMSSRSEGGSLMLTQPIWGLTPLVALLVGVISSFFLPPSLANHDCILRLCSYTPVCCTVLREATQFWNKDLQLLRPTRVTNRRSCASCNKKRNTFYVVIRSCEREVTVGPACNR